MSATTCARSGGAALYHAAANRDAAFDLLRMQEEMDAMAAKPETSHRIHRDDINRAWAQHARELRSRR